MYMAETHFFADSSARAAYLDWLDEPERERAARTIEMLEGIRAAEGPAWALFASAFVEMGPNRPHTLIRAWRQELAAEIDEATRHR